jgi:hypothetical protein
LRKRIHHAIIRSITKQQAPHLIKILFIYWFTVRAHTGIVQPRRLGVLFLDHEALYGETPRKNLAKRVFEMSECDFARDDPGSSRRL